MELRTTNPEEIDFKKKFELKEKVIIITGGMGLIGRAFAEGCARVRSKCCNSRQKRCRIRGACRQYGKKI